MSHPKSLTPLAFAWRLGVIGALGVAAVGLGQASARDKFRDQTLKLSRHR